MACTVLNEPAYDEVNFTTTGGGSTYTKPTNTQLAVPANKYLWAKFGNLTASNRLLVKINFKTIPISGGVHGVFPLGWLIAPTQYWVAIQIADINTDYYFFLSRANNKVEQYDPETNSIIKTQYPVGSYTTWTGSFYGMGTTNCSFNVNYIKSSQVSDDFKLFSRYCTVKDAVSHNLYAYK